MVNGCVVHRPRGRARRAASDRRDARAAGSRWATAGAYGLGKAAANHAASRGMRGRAGARVTELLRDGSAVRGPQRGALGLRVRLARRLSVPRLHPTSRFGSRRSVLTGARPRDEARRGTQNFGAKGVLGRSRWPQRVQEPGWARQEFPGTRVGSLGCLREHVRKLSSSHGGDPARRCWSHLLSVRGVHTGARGGAARDRSRRTGRARERDGGLLRDRDTVAGRSWRRPCASGRAS